MIKIALNYRLERRFKSVLRINPAITKGNHYVNITEKMRKSLKAAYTKFIFKSNKP